MLSAIIVFGLALVLGWLWFVRDNKRVKPQGPNVSDIEDKIRSRGIDPRSYGMSNLSDLSD